jgi:hypothetical protein
VVAAGEVGGAADVVVARVRHEGRAGADFMKLIRPEFTDRTSKGK